MSKPKIQPVPKKRRDMRLIWSSNAPWASSGYSVQTRDLLYRFLADGWPCACSCFYGLEGGMINVNGLQCYPKIGQQFGGDALFYHQQDFKADVAFTFQDIWVVDPGILPRLKNWISYCPIDHDPVPGVVTDKLKSAYRIVTFSRFGQKALEEQGLVSELILEACDINIFKPMDLIETRKKFGLPENIFMFGMVAANKDNPPRKSFQLVMDAFKRVHEKNPKTGIFFHTLLQQQGGFPIQDYAKYLGIDKAVYYPPPYIMMFKSPHPMISRVMNTFDCLLNPSTNEGFGLPIIEAQACGKPVIVNDFTSMPELIVDGVTGFKTDIAFKWWTPIQGYVAYPDLDSLYNKMTTVLEMKKEDRDKMGVAARKHIVENYDIDERVRSKWIPFLEKVQTEVLKT